MSKRIAVISVGVSEYSPAHFEKEANLKFADRAAEKMAAFFNEAYNGHADVNLLTNKEVSKRSLLDCATRLNRRRAYDLAIVFIACHGGGNGDDQSWLYLSDPEPERAHLTPEDLDTFFREIPAKQIVFLLDSCFAFSVARRIPFFCEPPAKGGGRVFITASGEREFAWEDEQIELPVFSNALLEELTRSSETGSRIDIESELFPKIRNRVAATTYQLKKGEEQSVLRGGVSTGSIKVRTVGGTLPKEQYWADAMRSGLWLWGRRVLLVVAAAFLAVVLFGYHLSPREDGRIEILRGVRSTAPLLPPILAKRADLPLHSEVLLETLPEDQRVAFFGGRLSGVWGQRTSDGIYGWLDQITEKEQITSLNSRLIIRSRYDPAYLEEIVDVSDWSEAGFSWTIDALSEARMLYQLDTINPLDDVDLSIIEPLGCSPDDSNDELSSFSWSEIQTEASSEVVTRLNSIEKAIISGARGGEKLLTDSARIIHARSKEPHQFYNLHSEFGAWLAAAESLKLASSYFGYPLNIEPLTELQDWESCEPVDQLVKTVVFESPLDAARTQSAISSVFAATAQSPLDDISWLTEFYLLVAHARNQSMTADQFDFIWKQLPQESNPETPHSLDRFIWSILVRGHIPPGTQLVAEYLNPTNDQRRSNQVLADFILASSLIMNESEREALRDIALELISNDMPYPLHDRRLIAQYAAAGFLSAEEMNSYWYDEYDFGIEYAWRRGDDIISVKLNAGVEDWETIVALAEAAFALKVPRERHAFFRDVAIEHASTRTPAIEALFSVIGQKYSAIPPPSLGEAILKSLRSNVSDADELLVETASAAHFIWSLDRVQKKQVVSELSNLWAEERAPQIRLCLAAIIFAAHSRDFTIIDILTEAGMVRRNERS